MHLYPDVIPATAAARMIAIPTPGVDLWGFNALPINVTWVNFAFTTLSGSPNCLAQYTVGQAFVLFLDVYHATC